MKKIVLVLVVLGAMTGCEDGAAGDTGATGTAGRDGAQGERGLDGRDGKDGKDGLPGPTGAQGPQGPAGPSGESIQGPQGAPGEMGPMGRMGPAGTPGQSIQGPAGPQGPKGDKGESLARDRMYMRRSTLQPGNVGAVVYCAQGDVVMGGGCEATGGTTITATAPVFQPNTGILAPGGELPASAALGWGCNTFGAQTTKVSAYVLCAELD